MIHHLHEATAATDWPTHLLSPGAGLPAPVTQLIGRDDAINDICSLLNSARLVTLTGPGGIGKTQLALAVARRLSDCFIDGIVLVELAAVSSPGLVLPTIATVFGLWETTSEPVEQRLTTYIADRYVLLVLDNAEHLLDAAPDIAALLGACAGLHILVTSRAPLHLRGEHAFDVPPLAIPPGGRALSGVELTGYPAIELFVRRAQATEATFTLTEQDAGSVAAICARLDGMPLAIELAASRIRVLSPSGILTRLDEQLLLLTGGPRDQPPRLQTMRGAIAWSHDLLDAGQQALFQRLAVFSGGWTLDAANAVCQPEDDVLEAISSLIASSLVRRIADPIGDDRFVMLEPIRQFALEQLIASGEIDAVRSRHADVFLALAEEAAPHLDWRDQAAWMTRLECDHDNFRTALAFLYEQRDAARGLRFIGALSWFWNIHGFYQQTRTLAQAFLDLPEAGGRTVERAKALGALAYPLYFLGEYEQARTHGEAALAINDEIGDQAGRARILIPLVMTALTTGDDRRHLLLSEDLLNTARELGDRENIARALGHLGIRAMRDGDTSRALALTRESLELSRQLGQHSSHAGALAQLGDFYCRDGDLALAADCYRESLAIYVGIDMRWAIASGLVRLAALACARAQWRRSARLYAAAAARRTAVGVVVPPFERVAMDADIASIRAVLSDEQFQSAWDSGRSLSLADAVAHALETEPSPAPAQLPAAGKLSPRECDVLRLIAAGQSNKQIASELFLSVHTIERHITNLYAKIGARGRADATAWALRHDLA